MNTERQEVLSQQPTNESRYAIDDNVEFANGNNDSLIVDTDTLITTYSEGEPALP